MSNDDPWTGAPPWALALRDELAAVKTLLDQQAPAVASLEKMVTGDRERAAKIAGSGWWVGHHAYLHAPLSEFSAYGPVNLRKDQARATFDAACERVARNGRYGQYVLVNPLGEEVERSKPGPMP